MIDPITFEVLRHRLSTIVDEGAAVMRNVSDPPGLSCFDERPLHEFPSELLRFEQSLKSCGSLPLFVILNTMTPLFTLLVESAK